jgi:hypothetical protein
MKTVGRRKPVTTLEAASRLQKLAGDLASEARIIPRGVYRFKTFEEAQEWWNKIPRQAPGRRRSKT